MPAPYRRRRWATVADRQPGARPGARACHNLTHCQFREDAGRAAPSATVSPGHPRSTGHGRTHQAPRREHHHARLRDPQRPGRRRHRRPRLPGRRRHPGRDDRGRRQVDDEGTTELDAEGLVVAPGIIDPHTHYDAQLFWDPTASPSNLHGVTTVIGGNCGFTLAPIKAEDHDYIRRMMAKVEGMPLVALENGLAWDWTTFGDYLGQLEGNLGVNAGFLVGHCAIRRWVMGDGPGRRGGHRRGGGRDGPPAGRVDRGRWARASRRPSPGPTPTATAIPSRPATPTAARCWPSARSSATTRAPRSSTSPTAASTRSPTRRST